MLFSHRLPGYVTLATGWLLLCLEMPWASAFKAVPGQYSAALVVDSDNATSLRSLMPYSSQGPERKLTQQAEPLPQNLSTSLRAANGTGAHNRSFVSALKGRKTALFNVKAVIAHNLGAAVAAASMNYTVTEKEWIVLIGSSTAVISFELLFLDKVCQHELLRHTLRLSLWISLAIGYCFLVKSWENWESAYLWIDGYVLDWVLSFDNLFAFRLVIMYFKVPKPLQRRAVLHGVIGAVAGRILFFEMFNYVFQVLSYFQPICGLFLIYTARCTLHDDSDDLKVSEIAAVERVKRILGSRLDSNYDLEGGGFFRWNDSVVKATPLLLVVVVLWTVDAIFAMDSVSAKVVAIPSQFLACSSSLLALMGMGAMYPILNKVIESVSMLNYAVAAILLFLGVQLIISPWVCIPASHELAVIGFLIGASLLASLSSWT